MDGEFFHPFSAALKFLLCESRKLYVLGEPRSFRSSPALHARTDVGVVIVRAGGARTVERGGDEVSEDEAGFEGRRRLPSYADAQMWQ